MKDIWWLSYASDEDVCRGVVIVEGDSFLDAVAAARRQNLSPGGGVRGSLVPAEARVIVEPHLNRFFTEEEARGLFDAKTDSEWENGQ